LLVQAAVVARTSVLASVASPRAVATGGFDLQPWPAGRAAVASERAPPSRAYRKLVEAWAWLGAWPRAGETCVDLGSAPGGWALTAAARGARVIAVDRAPPAAAVLRHPGVTFVRGSAFAYEPPGPVDWLLCDVICEPRRTIELVARWMERASCRAVVATLKFKGGGGYRAAGEARAALARFGWPFLRVKNLAHHHNEAAILARRG
jgi:23S rRNA (cytidine2498-2'-O)-methyltransferase